MLIASCQLLLFKDHASTAWAVPGCKNLSGARLFYRFLFALVKREPLAVAFSFAK
jgi:hypothetical protein